MLPRAVEVVLSVLVAFPIVTGACVAPLLLAQRWWGRTGMWITSLVWWLWFAGVAVYDNAQDFVNDWTVGAVFVAMFVAWTWTPAAFIDWAARRTPNVGWVKRMAWGMLGYLVGTGGAFLVCGIAGAADGLYTRLVR